MGRKPSTRICPTCLKLGVIRNGTTKTGVRRWRCTKCGASHARTRPDITDKAVLDQFLHWVTGKASQSEIGPSRRTFARRITWCWQVPVPPIIVTGEVYTQLFIDAKYLAYKWVLLTAVNQDGQVVARQWATSENAAAYTALLTPLPPPELITLDGAVGALKAIKHLWGQQAPPIQRCLLHVHRNNMRDLTRNPKTPAGKALKELSKRLLKVTDLDQAATWMSLLSQTHTQYVTWLNERTYAKDDPQEAFKRGKTRPGQWWYTHNRDRRVYQRLHRLAKEGTLFNFLTTHPQTRLHATTNPIESLNARINAVCYHHRGLTQPHLIQALEWALYTRSTNPLPTQHIYTQWKENGQPHPRIIPKTHTPPTPPTSPPKYDNNPTPEEGLHPRKGWAGRAN